MGGVCLVVDLAQGESAINGATQSSFGESTKKNFADFYQLMHLFDRCRILEWNNPLAVVAWTSQIRKENTGFMIHEWPVSWQIVLHNVLKILWYKKMFVNFGRVFRDIVISNSER